MVEMARAALSVLFWPIVFELQLDVKCGCTCTLTEDCTIVDVHNTWLLCVFLSTIGRRKSSFAFRLQCGLAQQRKPRCLPTQPSSPALTEELPTKRNLPCCVGFTTSTEYLHRRHPNQVPQQLPKGSCSTLSSFQINKQ